ncbi:MAG TPA: polysaccharide biosynthesis tyrosine autokinase [Acidobacteriaceae bacterium]|nr:polysaccharide biosynthesis tyrosine autokinase [Acidobacteriaceae bacterium]
MPAPVSFESGKRSLIPSRYTSPNYVPRPNPASDEESLKKVWRTLRKRKRWVLSLTACGLALAVVACIVIPRQYISTTTVQVGKDQSVQVELSDASVPTLSDSNTKTDIATHMAIIHNNNTALAVIHDLNLEQRKPFAFKPTLLGWLTGSNARIEAERGLPLTQAPTRRERVVRMFEKKLIVKNPPDTRLISVSFVSPNPQLSADVANAVVQEYVKFESEGQTHGEGISQLTSDLGDLRSKMESDQNQLADYERQTGLNSLILRSMGESAGGGSITHIPVLDKLDTLNQELTSAEASRIGKQAIYRLTNTRNSDVVAGLSNSTLPAIATSAVITGGNGLELLRTLRQEEDSLKLEYSADLTKYGARNPRMVELTSQLQSINRQIAEELEQINLRARNDYEVAQQNENALRAAFHKQESAASALNQSAVTLQVLVQQAASSRKLYDSLYQQIQEAGVQAGLRATNLRVTDVARSHSTPKRPNPPLYIAIGLAAGLLFGISSAFIREHMDETVKTPLQVDMLTPLPVLASIPLLDRQAPRQRMLTAAASSLTLKSSGETSPLLLHPRSSAAEAYRALRTSIVLANAHRPLRSIVVTSPLVGEGKTSVAYNMAIAFAHSGERVLMIDADLRHPHLHECFGREHLPGLCEVLGGVAPLESAIRTHRTVSNLWLLPSGNLPVQSSELFGSTKFDDLLEGLRDSYSLVVIDTPPILLVADAVLLSGKADSTLGVIRSDVTNRIAVERMAEMLDRNGCRAIGLALNGVNTSSVEYYQAYGYRGDDKYFKEA